jgi:hypothetical protein
VPEIPVWIDEMLDVDGERKELEDVPGPGRVESLAA